MNQLRLYFNRLSPEERAMFCARTGTSAGYIRKACSVGKIGPKLAIRIEQATNGLVSRSDLRPDLWPPEPEIRLTSTTHHHPPSQPATTAKAPLDGRATAKEEVGNNSAKSLVNHLNKMRPCED